MNLLFVCTGNTCRSAMAEPLMRARLERAGLGDRIAVRWADLILTMGQSHKRAILERHMEAFDKTFTLKEFVDDDPKHLGIFEEMDRLHAEAQTKQALFLAEHEEEIEQLQQQYQAGGGDAATEKALADLQRRLEATVQAESERMMELAQQLPNYDIADPFGGPQSVYDKTAQEIEAALDQLVEKLKEEV